MHRYMLTAPNIGVVIDYYIVCMIESHDFGILVTPLVQGESVPYEVASLTPF